MPGSPARSVRKGRARPDGRLHAFGAACRHLGCIVSFNNAEMTWDCPCHGSRYDARTGRVVDSPAMFDLPRVQLNPTE